MEGLNGRTGLYIYIYIYIAFLHAYCPAVHGALCVDNERALGNTRRRRRPVPCRAGQVSGSTWDRSCGFTLTTLCGFTCSDIIAQFGQAPLFPSMCTPYFH
jgi:hypothetical protein